MKVVVEYEVEVKARWFIFDPLVRNTKNGGVFFIFFSPYGNPGNAGEGDSSEDMVESGGKMRNEQRGTCLI